MPSPLVTLIVQIRDAVFRSQSVGANLWSALVDQAEGLENELSTLKASAADSLLESSAEDAEGKLKTTQAALGKALEEINRLRSEVGERDGHNRDHDKKLSEILVFLARDGQHDMSEISLAENLGFGVQLTKHYIERLSDDGLVEWQDKGEWGIEYGISRKGRAFLAERGLLN